jgi:hypothetical protein
VLMDWRQLSTADYLYRMPSLDRQIIVGCGGGVARVKLQHSPYAACEICESWDDWVVSRYIVFPRCNGLEY